MTHCECPEEGTRNVVAECLGKLTLIDPISLLPKLKSNLNSNSALTRSTVVTAVKFTISDQVCQTSFKLGSVSEHYQRQNSTTCTIIEFILIFYFHLTRHPPPPPPPL